MSSRALVLAFVVLTASAVLTQSRTVQWPYYGGDRNFTRYSPLDQINRENVGKLKIAWRKPAVDPDVIAKHPGLRVNAYLKSTPIMVDGILHVPNALGLTAAPMTYMVRGKQYIVVAVGDRKSPPEFVALTLP